MLGCISSRLLSEWMLYAQVEPFGEERADLRSAIVASTVANVQRDPKQQREPYTAQDFMPRFEPPEEPDPEERWRRILQKVEHLNAALGGRDLRTDSAPPPAPSDEAED